MKEQLDVNEIIIYVGLLTLKRYKAGFKLYSKCSHAILICGTDQMFYKTLGDAVMDLDVLYGSCQ